jgi:Uma2 family endonuclease
MSIITTPETVEVIVYPESDGSPMADNTRQFRWIVTIQGGFDAIYRERADVFVAGDLLWYPLEGKPNIRQAPDAMIVFGRPKGERGSYQQWREGNIAPQIVWEVLSPGNTSAEMTRKFSFYDRHGVEEYYVYDPDRGTLSGYLRSEGHLEEIDDIEGWISPRTLVTMLLEGGDLVLLGPDGATFASYLELEAQRSDAALRAEQERQRAEQERQRAEQERQRADSAEARAAALAARLRELGIDPDA